MPDKVIFPKGSRPLTARGGIRAQTKSRKVGKNWWVKKWMSVLENYYMGAELPRGRAYAQAGQVMTVDIAHRRVAASVQGSLKKPYKVLLQFKEAPLAQWDKLAGTLSTQAIYAAKLLAGQMPEYIEEAFAEQGISLFPEQIEDLDISCSCGQAPPCRHIIAVYYLLAEEFDRDPLLFLKLRGLDRTKLVESIGASRKRARAECGAASGQFKDDFHQHYLDEVSALEQNHHNFWNGGLVSEEMLGDVKIPPTACALARHLGHFPMWRGEERFLDALELIYKKASANGMNVFLGDW